MGYSAVLYRHDLDKKAIDALNAFPKFVKLKKAYIENVDEVAGKIDLLSSAIRISEKQFSQIYSLLPPICEKLEIAVPDLYYVKSKQINAATGGSSKPFIYVTSRLVNELPTDMVATVLAHECGHIACQHYLYHSMANLLIDGIDHSPLSMIPAVRKYLTPTLVNALLFWDRCSELSADRAAVLCDGNADRTVDMLLRIHGYKNIDREEFLKQAMDLRAFVNDSKSNRLMEQMLLRGESHPRLATRAYECYEWSKTKHFHDILSDAYIEKPGEESSEETDVISAEITVTQQTAEQNTDLKGLNEALNKVNAELERYTSHADKTDYAFAIAGGIITGVIDALFVGEISVADGDIVLSHKQVNNFIQQYAEARGFDNEHLADAIKDLENAFKVAQDNTWKGAGIGVSAKNHHLADLAHHPTPLGLASAIIVRFLRVGAFVSKDGKWHFLLVKTTGRDLIEILAPAVIAGILNWLVAIAEQKYENSIEHEIPQAIHKLAHFVASAPLIIEIAKCADNWFGHLVSDMGGSKNTAGAGMGIPGVFVSLLYEVAALPILKDSGLHRFVNDLYEKQKIDFRHEIPLYKAAGKQAVPVVFNEIYVRIGYFIVHLASEMATHGNVNDIEWNNVLPFRNRTVDRMLAVSSMTFTVADTTDAAIHAAIESGGNWVLFSGRFVTRFNYVGAGRAALAIVKEVSNEKKETQLIHEKMILSEAKTAIFLEQLQEFKTQLEEKVSSYLAEDIEAFMAGFDFIGEGLASGNSDLVMKGNITIQKVLGREPQFATQKEFDALMESDVPLKL